MASAQPPTQDGPDADAADVTSTSAKPDRRPSSARGPLVVSPVNQRYFTVASEGRKAVYLTGSHIWNNLHDGMGPGAACPETPEQFDYTGYLDFLAASSFRCK